MLLQDCPKETPSRWHQGEILQILKEGLVKLTLGWRPQTTWVFVANITNEFLLAPNVLCTHDASWIWGAMHHE
jgi:hypothetical protein